MTINIPSPDGKRVYSVNTNDPVVARQTVRRQLAKEWLLANPSGKPGRPTAMDTLGTGIAQGGSLGTFNVGEGGAMAAITGIKNLMQGGDRQKHPFGMKDAYDATRDIQAEKEAQSPFLSGVGGVIGGFRMPGADDIADFVGGKVGAKFPGLLGGLMTSKALPAVTVRAAVAGAPIGAIAGASAAKPGQEGKGAITGAITGAGAGTAVSGVAPLAARAAKVGGKAVGTVVGDILRGTANKSGLVRSDTAGVAMKEVVKALRADGATPDIVQKIQNDWLQTGATPPNLLDIASKLPSGGGATRRLIGGSAMSDLGSGAAGQYSEQVAANLPDSAEAIVRKALVPGQPQSAAKLQESVLGTRRGVASTMYPQVYQTRMQVTPDVADALADSHGSAAIQHAIDAATANRDYASADRLQALLQHVKSGSPDPTGIYSDARMIGELPTPARDPLNVTAGDLDRLRQGYSQRATNMMTGENADPFTAIGLYDRANQIDGALDRVPALKPARATYRALSNKAEAIDLGQGVLGPTAKGAESIKASDPYVEALQERTGAATPGDNPYPVTADEIRQAAGVGYRQGAINQIEGQPAGATGVINRLATTPRQIKIQDATFNPEGTDDTVATMREALKNEMTKLRNVRRVDPGYGSPTMDRAASLTDIAASIPKTPFGWAMKGLTSLHQGAALTNEERAAIVHTGLGELDMNGLIEKMHPDVQPILDTLDEYARTLAPTSSQGAAQAAAKQWGQTPDDDQYQPPSGSQAPQGGVSVETIGGMPAAQWLALHGGQVGPN